MALPPKMPHSNDMSDFWEHGKRHYGDGLYERAAGILNVTEQNLL